MNEHINKPKNKAMNGSKRNFVLAAVLASAVITTLIFIAAAEQSSAVTVNGTAVKYNRLQFVYSTSTSGDTTTISWSLCCNRTNSNYDTFKKSAPTVVKVNGTTVVNKNTYYDVRSGTKTLCSGTTKVARNNGAALNVPFYGSVNLTGTSVAGTITVSGNISLDAYTAGTATVTVPVDWIDNNNVDGGRPEKITVTLYQNGTAYDEKEMSSEETQVTFADVPKAYGGKAYMYTVGGSPASNYNVSEPAADGITYIYSIVPEMGFRIGFSI